MNRDARLVRAILTSHPGPTPWPVLERWAEHLGITDLHDVITDVPGTWWQWPHGIGPMAQCVVGIDR